MPYQNLLERRFFSTLNSVRNSSENLCGQDLNPKLEQASVDTHERGASRLALALTHLYTAVVPRQPGRLWKMVGPSRDTGSASSFRSFATRCAICVVFRISRLVVPFARVRTERSCGVSITPQGSRLSGVETTDCGFLNLQAVKVQKRAGYALRPFDSVPSYGFDGGCGMPIVVE